MELGPTGEGRQARRDNAKTVMGVPDRMRQDGRSADEANPRGYDLSIQGEGINAGCGEE